VSERGIRFSVQASPRSGREWRALAGSVEAAGFDALLVADHPGSSPSPFPALAAAAAVTTTLRLGTYVCNAGVRDPLSLASDAATVDSLSEGRFVLGLGAGHTPAEWTMCGRAYPSTAERVACFEETVEVVVRLLEGEAVTFRGAHVHTRDATVDRADSGRRIPLLVGGNGRRVLRVGAEHADVVSLTGLRRTLADGHQHEVDWSTGAIDERVELLRRHRRGDPPVLDVLVQHVEITGSPEAAAEQLAARVAGLTPAEVLACPFALVGPVDDLAARLLAYRDRWGISSYVVREPAARDAALLLRALS
jgi:probable F420-dependent oxidoreductase